MTEDEIVSFVVALDDVVVQRAGPGDGSPEVAWGDTFCYVSVDGTIPTAGQPFATVVTKDQPGDTASRLDRPGVFRVNVAAGRDAFLAHVGRAPRDEPTDREPAPDVLDTVIAHPVYGSLGWLAVVGPASRTEAGLRDLLRSAHAAARGRRERRG